MGKQTNFLEIWKTIYQQHFGIEIDISNIKIKPNMWPIYVHQGMKIQQVYGLLATLFPCWWRMNENLDDAVMHNDRQATESYVIWVAQNVEADEKFANKSAKTLKDENHKGITLLERLLLELFYYKLTDKHLDIKNVTLCTGSRDADGAVPDVGWDSDDKMFVLWYFPSYAHDRLRSREVVSV